MNKGDVTIAPRTSFDPWYGIADQSVIDARSQFPTEIISPTRALAPTHSCRSHGHMQKRNRKTHYHITKIIVGKTVES